MHKRFENLYKYNDQKIILGIRPENILIDETNSPDIILQPEVIEPVGNETILYFNLENESLIVRAVSSKQYYYKDKFNLKFNMDKVHFFSEPAGDCIL